MIGTFLTVAFLTLKNRILQRIRRLRQPRYLVGALAGAAYFWFLIFRHSTSNGKILMLKTFTVSPVITDVASLVLLLIMILAWALPGDSGGIEFSEAEIAFLFPAPLRRRDILLYKILRAQPQAIFSALVMTVLGWWRQGLFVGVWVTISGLSIYFMLVSLGRARLRLAHIGFIPRLIGVAAIVAALGSVAIHEIHKLPLAAMRDAPSFFKAIGPNLAGAHSPFQKPLIRAVLFIPRIFASAAIPSSLASLALSSLAVIGLGVAFFYIAAAINVSFEEASLAASQKRSARRDRVRGQRSGSFVMFRRAPAPFRLHETGPVEVAIIWKNTIALMRNSIAWVAVFAMMLAVILGMSLWWREATVYNALGYVLLWFAAFFPLFASTVFSNDLRLDMPRIEVLKSYPISGERLIAAEIAAPLAVIAILEMLFATGGSLLIGLSGEATKLTRVVATPQFIVAVLLLTLPICTVQLLIRNAVPVLFPAWAMRSKDEPRGFVMMGQRLILLAGNLLVLTVTLIPAAVVFLPSLWVTYRYFGGNAGFVAIAAMPAVAIIVTEVWFGVKALGAQFDQIDVSNETDVLVI